MTTSCFTNAVSFQEALQLVLSLADRRVRAETVPLAQCVGRIIETDIVATEHRPAMNLSAMDGYAVRHNDLAPGCVLPLVGESAAGDPAGLLREHTVCRILTGAPLPEGADTVIPQEDVLIAPEGIIIPSLPPLGAHIRRMGEEFARGDRLVEAGSRLDWRHVAILASQGIALPSVRRKIHISILANGKELVAPDAGAQPRTGQIFDSNSPMLAALLESLGVNTSTHIVATDTPDVLKSVLQQACAISDIVVTTGGISVGDTDHVHAMLRDLGADVLFRGVAIKPGKPLTVSTLGKTIIFGLPGNPTAAVVGVYMLLLPLIRQLYGQKEISRCSGILDFEPRIRRDLTQFIFVDMVQDRHEMRIRPVKSVGAADIMTLLRAKGLLQLDPDSANVTLGRTAEVILF
ncbi:molybdopterin molybdotransferase MoeA [Beijerinckia indica]|uniref:Molybdopterin molybdenumtransferase n=1 Tax=Beijerinckia indica subsp. indica (strain ATCC 9039 / DSM 1715 / NCIMB 8712) TaxID=395963 RepID=B2II53_BEII9|nr:molybdopterin molybdotransferase MoeA [Beijerinckia indica]ACB94636.1 molybdenum cofactor synthesis domain protein [Beijerinckia indica subsp. indica ATCC 9039]